MPIVRAEEEGGFLPSGTFGEVMKILSAVKSGDLKYEDGAHQMLEVHAASLRGQAVESLYEYTRIFLTIHGNLFRRFGAEVMNLLNPTHELIAVTAEPEYMARAVADSLGMDGVLSSEYEIMGGVFTGNVTRSLAHRDSKRSLLSEVRPNFAFGDSSGDIEMLSHARHAFCIAPDDELAAAARENSWETFDGDNDTTLITESIARHLQNIKA